MSDRTVLRACSAAALSDEAATKVATDRSPVPTQVIAMLTEPDVPKTKARSGVVTLNPCRDIAFFAFNSHQFVPPQWGGAGIMKVPTCIAGAWAQAAETDAAQTKIEEDKQILRIVKASETPIVGAYML